MELCVCPWCLPSAGHMSQRLPWEVRADVADGHLWCQHPTGIKDAALSNVTNVWLHTHVLIWSDSKTQRLFRGIRMICTPESLHSVRTGLKPWSVMPLDNVRMWAVYMKKKNIQCKEHNPGGMCLKMSPPSRESTAEQEGMMPGGPGDLIINTASGAKEQLALHHPLPALTVRPLDLTADGITRCYIIIFSQANYTTQRQQLQL